MHLLLEGPAIEPLLARVRDEHGPAARIVRAERRRSGGVAGFFTRESFEVTVEVPGDARVDVLDTTTVDDAAAPVHVAPQAFRAYVPPAGAVGIDALVAAAEAAERGHEDVVLSTRGLSAAAPPAATPVPTPPVLDPAPHPSTPHVSTESPAFAAVLAALHARAETPAPAARPVAPVVWPTLDDAVVVEPVEAPELVQSVVVEPEDTVASVVVEPEDVVDDITTAVRQSISQPEPEPGLQAELRPETEPAETRRRGRSSTTAAEVGALLDVVRDLPAVPAVPHRAGFVTLVVGDAEHADAAGARVAEQLHLTPEDVVVVGRRRTGRVCGGDRPALTSAEQVSATRRTLRSGDVPAVVVLEVGPAASEQVWAADVLDSLRADHVVAVVDAGRKAADLQGWLARLEGAGCWVDALSVHGAARTSDPESVLDLGLPVAEIDGVTAGPAVWAALLLDRVTTSRRVPCAPATRASRRRAQSKDQTNREHP